MKQFLVAAFLFTALSAQAQNFDETTGTPGIRALEKLIKNYGTPTRTYLSDTAAKTFVAKPGEMHLVVFVFSTKDLERKTIVHALDASGNIAKTFGPNSTTGYKGGGRHAFGVTLQTAATETGPVTYKINGSPRSTVYLYKITPGVVPTTKPE